MLIFIGIVLLMLSLFSLLTQIFPKWFWWVGKLTLPSNSSCVTSVWQSVLLISADSAAAGGGVDDVDDCEAGAH